ncbi:MAG: hypothetical protein IJE68_01565 [Clostridia bacterium]|nr:hypothetical protein [Clostridia bacterium]
MMSMYSDGDESTPKNKNYFYASELAQVDLPKEKKQNLIQRAIQWIKERKTKYLDKKTEDVQQKNTIREEDKQR